MLTSRQCQGARSWLPVSRPNVRDSSRSDGRRGLRYAACARRLACWKTIYQFVFVPCLLGLIIGCGTTTKRTATEQLLMSDAVDNAIAKIDFRHLAQQSVYLDTTYVSPVRAQGFVNAPYVISSIRQQLAAAGCRIQDTRDEADIIVEPRIGTLGADGHEVTFGIPKSGGIAAAASAISGNPLTALPEISFAQSNAQSGVAKVYVFAYSRETKEPIWQSGVAKAESNCSSTWILGAGPIQRGSIFEQPRFAGRKLTPVGKGNVLRSGLIDSTAQYTEQMEPEAVYQAPRIFAELDVPQEKIRVAAPNPQASGDQPTILQ